MKHPFIILGGTGITLMLAASMGLYFVFLYTPSRDEAREQANPFIEVGGAEFNSTEGSTLPNETLATTTERSALRSFTARKVAGAIRIAGGGFRFVEAGTGHIYETGEGVERKISLTTFPQVHSALWSSTGKYVVMMQEERDAFTYTVGSVENIAIETGEFSGVPIPGSISNVAWSTSGETLYYVSHTSTGSEGIAWDQKTNERSSLFTTALHQITVSWSDDPLIMTRAANGMLSYAYRGDHRRVTEPLEALRGIEHNNISLYTGKSGDTLISWIVRGKDTVPLARGVIPEKCSLGEDELVCAAPRSFISTTYPDEWHRGEVTYSDEVVRFDARTGEEAVLGAVDRATHNSADVIRMSSTIGGYLLITRDREAFFVATDTANTPDTTQSSQL
ncbi:MAG: hypothetical protein RLZZ234_663 [Candidatus Parcubacteria bacterium]|jgi:hypothetical protein